MLKKSAIAYIFAGMAAMSMVCCNSEYNNGEYTYSSTVVSSFKLSKDDSVARNLDSVFFSIDLTTYRIYNADSLPYGTRTNKFVPIIEMLEGASLAEFTVQRDGKSDTVFDYLANPKDTIDFTHPVQFRVVSFDKSVTRTYTIEVNVHQIKPDSLFWSRPERKPLPSTFQVPNDQWTAATAEAVYCITRYQNDYCVASSANPGNDDWQKATTTFGFTPRLESLRGTDDALYILSDAGELYTSADGKEWTSCGINADYLYGGYQSTLIASRKMDDGWHRITYPVASDCLVDADFPVAGTSLPVIYTTPMGVTPQLLLTGGRLADDTLTNDTWGFDGTDWAKLSIWPLPVAVENAVVVPYFTFKESSKYWVANTYATLIAFGGNMDDGKLNDKVYLSQDFGVTWKEAQESLQLPGYVPAMTCAQGFVYSSELSSRATRPINEWDCPFIYIFGGRDAQGNTYNTLWKAVINRYTFKPLY